jgi:hypothetical protein
VAPLNVLSKGESFPSGNERTEFNEQQTPGFDGRRSGVQWL